ncbi:MAG: hypothetical protein GX265_00450 [Mollicutes bacterium]|nr:hypothetical protein [Mollicutes bacterium]
MDAIKLKKEELYNVAENINKEDIKELIENLLSQDDKVRYPSFLILKYRSDMNSDIFPYWNDFINMLDSDNSYFRTIGLSLLSINTKWCDNNIIKGIIDKYLSYCDDEKLSTARLCIQGISNILKNIDYDQSICEIIVNKLINLNVKERPSTNLKVLTTDIINILMQIQKEIHFKEIVKYLNNCLNENIIDKKLKQEITELLN